MPTQDPLSAPGMASQTTRSGDRKSTRLNSSHVSISYAVFCLKKKKQYITTLPRCSKTPHPTPPAPTPPCHSSPSHNPSPAIPPRYLSSFSSHPPPTPQTYTLSLHDALPICAFAKRLRVTRACCLACHADARPPIRTRHGKPNNTLWRSEEHTSELQSRFDLVCRLLLEKKKTIHNHITTLLKDSTPNSSSPYAALSLIALPQSLACHPPTLSLILFFSSSADPPDLHSFPTRRSSDLRFRQAPAGDQSVLFGLPCRRKTPYPHPAWQAKQHAL